MKWTVSVLFLYVFIYVEMIDSYPKEKLLVGKHIYSLAKGELNEETDTTLIPVQ